MSLIADLHLHSKYSRAVSGEMIVPNLVKWAGIKGLDLLGTGDFTHPLWFKELQEQLTEEDGVLRAKEEGSEVRFLLTTEISSIYSQGGKTRKIHNLIIAPSFTVAEKINGELKRRGANLLSDGRPIVGLSAKDLLSLVLEIDENSLFIPAHIWTPWFSLFGSKSGFSSVEECFGDLAKYILAVETGLSSDPAMNWRIADLNERGIVSFSDAHSLPSLAREATILQVEKISYDNIRQAIAGGKGILSTIEFYPEEGKYHYTGHRVCKVCHSPEETAKRGTICPVCGRPLTVGVMHQVQFLSRSVSPLPLTQTVGEFGVRSIGYNSRPPYIMLVPLLQIIAEAEGVGRQSKKVEEIYQKLIEKFGSELRILTKVKKEDLQTFAGEKLAEGIVRVRAGQIFIQPGFDGEFGVVSVWPAASSF